MTTAFEGWAILAEAAGLYEISTRGEVRRADTGRMRKHTVGRAEDDEP